MTIRREIVSKRLEKSNEGILQALKRLDSRSGQAMVEYAIIAALLISSIAILALFMYAFKAHGGRVLDLVSSEYP